MVSESRRDLAHRITIKKCSPDWTWVVAVLLYCGALFQANLTAAEPAYHLRFDRSQYVINPGQEFEVQVLIDPVPPEGLFSFGVLLGFPQTNAVVIGASSIQPVTILSHDGPRGSSPVVGFGPGFAAAKGSADLFDERRPSSTNALLVTFLVRDQRAGAYSLSLTNFNTLGPSEQIFVDGAGGVLDPLLTFGRATVVYGGGGALEAQTNSPISLNRQSGLFEQVVRVTNATGSGVNGFRLFVTDLPSSWRIWNAHGQTNGLPYFTYDQTLVAGASVDFRVEFRIPDRNPTSQPGYRAEPAFPDGLPFPDGTSFTVVPRGRLPDGSFLVEFDSLLTRSYLVQYSFDLTNWRTALPSILGNGSRLQWIDAGPPKTDLPPDQSTNRYYRIFLLPQ